MVMGLGKKKTTSQTLRDRASELLDSLAPHVEAARSTGASALADARDKAAPVIADAAAKAGPALSEARDRARDALGDARDKAAPVLADARDKAAPVVAPYVATVKDKAGPVLSDARERTAPVVDRVTHDLIPALAATLGAVNTVTEDARADAAERGSALAASVRDQVNPPPKKRPIRNSLISLGAGAITFAAVRRLADRNRATADWQTAYTPPPAPATVPTTDTAAAPARRTTRSSTSTSTGRASRRSAGDGVLGAPVGGLAGEQCLDPPDRPALRPERHERDRPAHQRDQREPDRPLGEPGQREGDEHEADVDEAVRRAQRRADPGAQLLTVAAGREDAGRERVQLVQR
jgi:cell division septum initiation protein DivIVA